jgi:hypothetical protein
MFVDMMDFSKLGPVESQVGQREGLVMIHGRKTVK